MAVLAELTQQMEDLAVAVFSEVGVEIVEFSLRQQGAEWLVNILADKPSGGITSGECIQLNRRIVVLLEENKLLGEDFSLEISSPGLDRPLKTRKDFLRVLNRQLRVLLAEPVDGKHEYAGQMILVKDEAIVLKRVINPGKKIVEFVEIEIPLGKIQKAVQII